MRGFAYTIAVIAAVGIMISIAVMPPTDSNVNPSEVSNVPIQSVTLSVPEMSCEFSCFPKVKETLEATNGVHSVELAEQKEEGTIDNRQVIVQYDSRLNLKAALNSLASEGFTNSDVVQ